MAKKIFISYSGFVAEQLAELLQETMVCLFSNEIEVCVASRSNFSGDFQEELEEQLRESDFLLMLFTPHNNLLKGHWQMYEAGFFRSIEKERGIQKRRLINYAFCSYTDDVAKPVSKCNGYQYRYNGKEDNLTQSRYLKDMMVAIGRELNLSLNDFEIQTQLKRLWDNGLSGKLATLADKAVSHLSISGEERVAQTKSNAHMDASVFKTTTQLMYTSFFGNDVHGYTPRTLELYFQTILEKFLPIGWVKKLDEFKDENGNVVETAHRVLIGNTRISTFVAFTDGENILLFDRAKADKGKTNVMNNRLDVFGSVQFENRTIKKKILSESFLKKNIKELKPIYGAAFEDNHAFAGENFNDNKELAIMFGVFAVMSKEDLLLALENNKDDALCIMPINQANNIQSENLTSKAFLSIKQLSDWQKLG